MFDEVGCAENRKSVQVRFLKTERSKILTSVRMVLRHIRSDKNNISCVQCADKEHFKTLPKHSLATDFRTQLYCILVVVVASDAVIFAVNYSSIT